MGALDFNLGGLIPDSAFVNDGVVAQANADAAVSIAQVNANAALVAQQTTSAQQADTIKTVAIVVAIIFVIVAILWFFK